MRGPSSSAWLYGKGIFTTLAIFHGKPLLWEKHCRRLMENAAKVGIDISEYDEESVANALAEIISKHQVTTGRARITFSDESPSEVWGSGGETKVGLSIITAGPRSIPDNFKLSVSPHRVNTTSPLTGVKSCNYLEHLMALDEARSRGFDEAIRLNERGEIASACMANVFWLKSEKLCTPSLKTGCLAGTTREFVLESLECEEVEVGIEALTTADAIFLTSAGIGVVKVAEFEGRQLSPQDHPILDLLPKAEPPA
jgi:branched-subunit amino acid aminotransferase/4-amino-4-deoxychorismate lyase